MDDSFVCPTCGTAMDVTADAQGNCHATCSTCGCGWNSEDVESLLSRDDLY